MRRREAGLVVEIGFAARIERAFAMPIVGGENA